MDVRKHNRHAWNQQVECGNPWTIPVGESEIAAAKHGRSTVFLTPTKPVPLRWLEPLQGREILCLASGGGQQGPVLAAAGATVTILDNSPNQLARDRDAAEHYGLQLCAVEGDMRDLSMFGDRSFDLIVHPVSNAFIPDVTPVWKEAYRVLRQHGELLSGFGQAFRYIFDDNAYEQGVLEPAHILPYSDLDVLSQGEIDKRFQDGKPLEFSHSLEEQIGGQIDAGFVITGLYEDRDREERKDLLSRYTSTYVAIRASKADIKRDDAEPAVPRAG
ncbi:MAG: class I SAM-dependent methyltransferase [bacterium]